MALRQLRRLPRPEERASSQTVYLLKLIENLFGLGGCERPLAHNAQDN
jgi:hypothetical protein